MGSSAAAQVAALILLSTSCSNPTQTTNTSADVSNRSLPVIRVCAETGFRAGTRIGPGRLITLVRPADTTTVGVVAEGRPWLRSRCIGEPIVDPRDQSEGESRLVIHHGDADHDSLTARNCPRPPSAGEIVYLAGFALRSRNVSAAEFWTMAPTTLTGRVIDPPSPGSRRSSSLVYVEVPADDYRGFIGGPAASLNGIATCLWGVIIGHVEPQAHLEGASRRSTLVVHHLGDISKGRNGSCGD